MIGTYKNIKSKEYENGRLIFECESGHRTDYVLGSGLKKDPYICPECNERKPRLISELKKIINNRKIK